MNEKQVLLRWFYRKYVLLTSVLWLVQALVQDIDHALTNARMAYMLKMDNSI